MDLDILLITQLLICIFPTLIIVLLKKPIRIFGFYGYLGILLTFMHFSGNTIACAVILYFSIVMVIIEQDAALIRNTVLFILISSIFFYLADITDTAFTFLYNPLPIFIIRTLLLSIELIALFLLIEYAKRVVKKPLAMRSLFSFFFVFVVILDGFLFPLLSSVFVNNLKPLGMDIVLGRLILGAAFSIPFYLLLLIHKKQLVAYSAQPFSLSGLFIPQAKAVCTPVPDVMEIQKEEKKLRRLNAMLLEKNNALEKIIYSASHDLRSPLVNIKGFSEELHYSANEMAALIKDLPKPENTAEQINSIINTDIPRWVEFVQVSINRITGILSSLLQLSRLNRNNILLQPVDIDTMVNHIIKTFGNQIMTKGISMEKTILPPCIADYDRIQQVFIHLIDNSVKFLKPGIKGEVKISGETTDEYVIYNVEDNGIGIDEKYHKLIFDCFYRLNPRIPGGEGIGLTLVKNILNSMNGEIFVTSALTQGSRFTIKLPRHPEEENTIAALSESPE